eukprot:TRINITY_DN26274_c0_g1_i1.p1 TRINITY_DN26274_c0_g1~~TRINITY_DN26274_c0_g1_i1.p1  ORF type:complete len:685 (+),score=148.50 TRINITY_DN26274_c0_g1_i1:46-2055(+)
MQAAGQATAASPTIARNGQDAADDTDAFLDVAIERAFKCIRQLWQRAAVGRTPRARSWEKYDDGTILGFAKAVMLLVYGAELHYIPLWQDVLQQELESHGVAPFSAVGTLQPEDVLGKGVLKAVADAVGRSGREMLKPGSDLPRKDEDQMNAFAALGGTAGGRIDWTAASREVRNITGGTVELSGTAAAASLPRDIARRIQVRRDGKDLIISDLPTDPRVRKSALRCGMQLTVAAGRQLRTPADLRSAVLHSEGDFVTIEARWPQAVSGPGAGKKELDFAGFSAYMPGEVEHFHTLSLFERSLAMDPVNAGGIGGCRAKQSHWQGILKRLREHKQNALVGRIMDLQKEETRRLLQQKSAVDREELLERMSLQERLEHKRKMLTMTLEAAQKRSDQYAETRAAKALRAVVEDQRRQKKSSDRWRQALQPGWAQRTHVQEEPVSTGFECAKQHSPHLAGCWCWEHTRVQRRRELRWLRRKSPRRSSALVLAENTPQYEATEVADEVVSVAGTTPTQPRLRAPKRRKRRMAAGRGPAPGHFFTMSSAELQLAASAELPAPARPPEGPAPCTPWAEHAEPHPCIAECSEEQIRWWVQANRYTVPSTSPWRRPRSGEGRSPLPSTPADGRSEAADEQRAQAVAQHHRSILRSRLADDQLRALAASEAIAASSPP